MTGAERHGTSLTVWDQLLSVVNRQRETLNRSALDIVDVGGGSGTLAVPLAADGHAVTVVDPSPNALATLRQRAREAGVTEQITPIQGDAAGLRSAVPRASVDVVVCHGVLEVVDEPQTALTGMVDCLRPGAIVSIVAAQRSAAVIGKALAGHLEAACRLLEDPEGRWGSTDPLPRRFTEAGLRKLVDEAGLTVDAVHGVRMFSELVPGAFVDDPVDMRALATLEERAAELPEMRSLAAALHIVASLT
ncbi:methyltransferase domain-containing protein [Actinobacteria bacterium YIM 96077]|uniref:SAM-dependent methyltransferase n=2 Tax=Phytoactinopolyspora halophila TaxID=1981511 RepID=A0A329QVB3_9ACTN|nr:methyltransferase domain-containing protein [Actinobacteria bacterium YIM 96077]RAW16374.1 SAM-dependent methyltransferase [Phytoactinopolyspora halophila]